MEAVVPKPKYKTFTYHTGLHRIATRAAMLSSEDKPAFRVASPPEFKGETDVWTPEDLFVAAAEICTMTTFISFTEKAGLHIADYQSRANGILEFVEGGYRFTKIIVRPKIAVDNEADLEKARSVMHDAHKKCLIANSMKTEVIVEAEFVITETA